MGLQSPGEYSAKCVGAAAPWVGGRRHRRRAATLCVGAPEPCARAVRIDLRRHRRGCASFGGELIGPELEAVFEAADAANAKDAGPFGVADVRCRGAARGVVTGRPTSAAVLVDPSARFETRPTRLRYRPLYECRPLNQSEPE